MGLRKGTSREKRARMKDMTSPQSGLLCVNRSVHRPVRRRWWCRPGAMSITGGWVVGGGAGAMSITGPRDIHDDRDKNL